MKKVIQRLLVAATLLVVTLSAASSWAESEEDKFATIDSQADNAFTFLLANVEHAEALSEIAVGVLIMPLVTEVGLLLGGSYGEGVLRIGGVSAGYYSSHQLSYGLQFGGQQYSHVLFFLNEDVLDNFRNASGWSFGAEIEGAVLGEGQIESIESITSSANVVGIVFGQAGLHIGASLEGTKYSLLPN